ncbi:MAG: hypothetical protein ACJ78Q_05000 [Chloroflexia bacterium]
MNGKSKIVWPVALLVLVLLSPALQAAARSAPGSGAKPAGGEYGRYHYGFDDSTKPWASLADGVPSYSLTRMAGDNGCADISDGVVNGHYARLSSGPAVLGSHPPVPATWMVAGLPAGLGEFFVRVSWSARLDNIKPPAVDSAGVSCQTCYPTAYIGMAPPQEGAQLQVADAKSPLDKSWRSYEYTSVVESYEKGMVFVALGWNGVDMSVGIDCIDVAITPIVH